MDASSLPLRDVIAPLTLGWWPPAPGWWLVFVLLLLLLGGLARILIRRLRNPYTALRKTALLELNALQLADESDDGQYAEGISSLLKRIAIARYTNQRPAKLSGQAWLAFLDNSNSAQSFSQMGGEVLFDAQYQPMVQVNREQLFIAAQTWIKSI